MSWLEALKEYSKESGKWAVPKKGSPEYEAVKKIQDRMDGVAEKKPVEKQKFIRKVEKIIEAPPKEPVKTLTKEEHYEEVIKPRMEHLKKLSVKAKEDAKKDKEAKEKMEAEEKATKAKKNAKRPMEEVAKIKASVKATSETLKAERLAKKEARLAELAEKEAKKVVVEEKPVEKVRKPRVSKAKMTIEQTPVVLEFK